MTRPTPPILRLLRKLVVNEQTGCWEFSGARSSGYGILSSRRGCSPLKAHRVSFEARFGPIPEGLVVRHRCDNPACCNPDHLQLGTQKDNARDASQRGRLNPASLNNLRPGAPGFHGAGPTSKGAMNGIGQ